MSAWARSNPEAMEEIAALPAPDRLPAMRERIGWSRDRHDELGDVPNRCRHCRERFSGPVCDNCGEGR